MDIGNCTHGFTEEKDPHWNRRDIAGFVSGFEQAAPEVSQREFAREHHIPRSTLQFWIDRKRAIDLPPPLAAFFESTTGVEFLQFQSLRSRHRSLPWNSAGSAVVRCSVFVDSSRRSLDSLVRPCELNHQLWYFRCSVS